jgi:hypothetical protein
MNRSLTLSLAVAAALTLSACGDSGTGPDDNGGNNGDTREIVADPSYANVIQEIFNRRGCASGSCHGSAQAAGLSLTSSTSYANLVNVTATQSASSRVIPGDANGSYLIVKVEGRQTVGNRMPPSGSALDNIDLTNLKNWINQGAKNN